MSKQIHQLCSATFSGYLYSTDDLQKEVNYLVLHLLQVTDNSKHFHSFSAL